MRKVTRTQDNHGETVRCTWDPPFSNRDGWVNEVVWVGLTPGAADAIEDWLKSHHSASAFTMFDDVNREVVFA